VVSDDSLGARLVMHVHDELFAGLLKHRLRPDLKSRLTFEIKLYTDTMYQFIILRNLQSMRCTEQCGAMKTDPKVLHHPHRHVRLPIVIAVVVVLNGVCRLPPTGVVNYAMEVGLQQKT
jgi:hypothetical protein